MGMDKLWLDLEGRPLIAWTLRGLAGAPVLETIVIAAPRDRWDAIARIAADAHLPSPLFVEGGERRQDSVRAALACCVDSEWVCVHDAARPLVSAELVRRALDGARASGAATTAVPCVDTIKAVRDDHVVRTLDRSELMATQTPQAFRTEILRRAHDEALSDGLSGDDDAFLVERLGVIVKVVAGDVRNIKVTYAHDIDLVRVLRGIAV
jgi:2-C-methyl-D-erythritol 4-phosphate cytidylyltransferase